MATNVLIGCREQEFAGAHGSSVPRRSSGPALRGVAGALRGAGLAEED